MRYSEVTFFCQGGEVWQQELLIQELGNAGFDTFEERPSGFVGYIASDQLDTDLLDRVLIMLPLGFVVDYEVKEIKPQNWNILWESNFDPIVVGNQCYVRATFHDPKPEFPYELVIDPKMSFGTGHHQTTSMMLQYILEGNWENKHLLDMGCGTGILSVLAAKMGASSVLAIDYDANCIDNTQENAKLNNVEPIISVKIGSDGEIIGLVFDSIFANINRNILLDHLKTYADALKKGGTLYVSGFYRVNDLNVLIEKAKDVGLYFISEKFDEPWSAAQFQKSD